MFRHASSSGKHLICDIKEIQRTDLLNDVSKLRGVLDIICEHNHFSIIEKTEHSFENNGFSIVYLLAESHISIHSFPEKNYFAFDLYSCRKYDDNVAYNTIYEFLILAFEAKREMPLIIDRLFH
jgi:S-adenosylmethionine decarboxylase proenzyme